VVKKRATPQTKRVPYVLVPPTPTEKRGED
jgi:hypothetical protein